ncbi:phospholipid carrier-dependent glycosyltransferase [Thermosynechococcus sp.]|uniref:phospholipid carrier-dependent glycosyltransferase n=1 Tax=Thermosynechococcus sp. TaxID=2814275 RepID=UPI00391C6F1C
MVTYFISSAVVAGAAAIAACLVFPHQPLNAIALFLSLTLVQITVVTLVVGILNLLTPLSLLIGSIVTAGLLMTLLLRHRDWFLVEERDNLGNSQSVSLSAKGWIAALGLAILVTALLHKPIAHLYNQVTSVHPLVGLDVVTYHLPNAIGYLQSHGLWRLSNRYSQYPGGNELINLWSLVPLHHDGALGLTTFALNLGLLLAVLLLLRDTRVWKYSLSLYLSFLLFLLAYFFIPSFRYSFLYDVGRNDVTVTYWVLMGFWTWMTFVSARKASKRFWLLWSGLNFGCALGVKPNALYYIVGFGLLTAAHCIKRLDRNALLKQLREVLLFWLLPMILVSSFWYLRNFYLLGGIFEKDLLEEGSSLVIAKHIFNPSFYNSYRSRVTPILVLLNTILVILVLLRKVRHRNTYFLICFNVIAFLAWLLTPFGAGPSLSELALQARLGGSYIVGLVVLLICIGMQFTSTLIQRLWSESREIFDQLFRALHCRLKLRGYLTLALVGGSFAVWTGMLLGQAVAYQPPRGLPGWEKGLSPLFTSVRLFPLSDQMKKSVAIYESTQESRVYEWIHENIHDSRILNLGLASYGLVNFPFSNEVIVPYRISEASDEYDYITVLLFHPHEGTYLDPERWKPFVKTPELYRPVFRDHLALVLAKQPLPK